MAQRYADPSESPEWIRWDRTLLFALFSWGIGIICGLYLAVMLA